MKVTVSGSLLYDALSAHLNVIGSPHISLKASDDMLHLYSTHKGRSLHRSIEAKVIEDGELSTEPYHLAGIVKGRQELTMTLSESSLQVKSGRYKAEVNIIPYEEISFSYDRSESDELDFEAAEVDSLVSLCNQAQLTSPVLDGGNLPILVRINEKGTTAACIDNFHMSVVRNKDITRDNQLDIILPSGVLPLLQKAANDGTYTVSLAQNMLYAEGADFTFVTPTEQATCKQNLNHARILEKQIKESSEVTSIKVSTDELNLVLDNVYSVSESNAPISLEVKGGKKGRSVLFGTKSSYGSAHDEIEAAVEGDDVSANFTSYLLSEILMKIRAKEVTLNVLPKLLYISETVGATRHLLVLIRV